MGLGKRLPDSELDVMLVIWRAEGPVTRLQLEECLTERGWAVTTLNTLLSRLQEKGFLSCKRQGKSNYYTPVIDCGEYQKWESSSFLQRLFGNSVRNFVAAAVDAGGLEDADIRELEQYLEELKREGVRHDDNGGTV